MPSTLRFRSPYRPQKGTQAPIPRTPKSPHGAFTGVPIPHLSPSKTRLLLKLLFGILSLAALLSLGIFTHRHALILDFPTRSSVYWKAKSALHGASAASSKKRHGFGPPVGEAVQAVFADQDAFQVQGARGDRAWSRMLPKGDGRVLVRDPRRYGLPGSAGAEDGEGVAVPDTEVFEVAIVRQLECMAFLRQVLIDYDHEMHPSAHDRSRAYHCLDHVRQALLCAADTTLEPTGNGGIFMSAEPQHYVGYQAVGNTPKSGFQSALHTCKNWTAVKDWIEDNRVH